MSRPNGPVFFGPPDTCPSRPLTHRDVEVFWFWSNWGGPGGGRADPPEKAKIAVKFLKFRWGPVSPGSYAHDPCRGHQCA